MSDFSYQTQLEMAINLAVKYHRNQKDKGGNPYIEHPLWVMSNVTGIKCKIAAVLHDIVEDTKITIEDLKIYGFDDEIVDAIRLLTRNKNVTYEKYIDNLFENPIAVKVKLKDLEHNMDLSRLTNGLTEKDKKRQEKYERIHEYILNRLEFGE